MDWKYRTAYVFIKTHKGKAHEVWKRFQSWDNVIGTWLVDGNWDVIVWFDASDWDTIHKCVESIKEWHEVEHTSSHMVYNGYKNDNWWWEKPAGAWVLFREDKLNQANNKLKQWISEFVIFLNAKAYSRIISGSRHYYVFAGMKPGRDGLTNY